MSKFLRASLIVLACLTNGLPQSRNRATAREKTDLLRLILKENKIRQDIKDFEIRVNDVAKATRVRKVDLNGDSQPEYIVVIEDGALCGALGNCPDWVYGKAGSEYKLLLHTRGRELLREKTSTNGYRDLRSEGGDTAFESDFIIYKYDGSKYRAKQCFSRESTGKVEKATGE